MRTIEVALADTVTVGNAGLSGGDGVLVGSPPIWKDSSDGSYAEFAGQYFGPGEPQFVGTSGTSVLAPADPLPSHGDHAQLRVRLKAITNAGQKLPRVSLIRVTSGATENLGAEPTTLSPTSATWVTYTLTGSASDLDMFLARPYEFEVRVYAPVYSPAPMETQRWQIYEVRLDVVTLGGEAPPCRMFPRSDGLGVGGGRNYPPAKSQQRSSRGVGYY